MPHPERATDDITGLNDGEKFNQYNVDFHDFSNQVLNYGGGSQLKRNRQRDGE